MHIANFSRFIALPFAIAVIFSLTTNWLNDNSNLRWVILLPSVVILALIYVFTKEINQWWWKRRPPRLDKHLKKWVLTFSPIFSELNNEEKIRFSERLSVFIHTKEFTLKGKQDFLLEEDIKALIAHEYVRITMNQSDYLFSSFDQFVVYNHPFPTPEYQFLHSFEIFDEDGVIIYSKPGLINGFPKKSRHLNLALFGAVSTYISMHPRLQYPDVRLISEEAIEDGFNIKFDAIKKSLGFDWVNKLNVFIYCYFRYPKLFESNFKNEHSTLQKIFG